jgi:hypothetical protein
MLGNLMPFHFIYSAELLSTKAGCGEDREEAEAKSHHHGKGGEERLTSSHYFT